jgi:PBP1b-binding outer membrane lipoprotein LpoB
MKSKLLLCLPLLLIAASCATPVKTIDPDGDEAVVSAGVDYAEIIEWTNTLTDRMLNSGFLDTREFGEPPVKMVVSKIENKTDLSHFPQELLVGNIRSALLQSGKARWVSTYGADGTDEMTRDTQDLKDDPLFDSSQVPEQGQATVARLSLRTQVLWTHSQGVDMAQNTYVVRMFITDVRNGEVVWENRSDPIAKKFERGSVGW